MTTKSLGQNHAFIFESRQETGSAIGAVITGADRIPDLMNVESETPGLFFLRARRGIFNLALAFIRDRLKREVQFQLAADLFQTVLKKRKGLRGQRFLVDPAPGDMHVLPAGFLIDMKGDGTGLASETEHLLNAVGGMFPLLPGERLALAVPDLDMKEGLLAFRAGGHDMHIAESILDVGRLETTKLPQLGAFSGLAARQIGGEPRPVVMRGAFADHCLCVSQCHGLRLLPRGSRRGPRSIPER
jgi:hypothetical protein